MSFLSELEDLREKFVAHLEDLDAMLEQAKDPARRVSLGQILWVLRDQMELRLEPLKKELRLLAKGAKPGTIKLAGETEDHLAAITVPSPKFVLRKGVDVDELKLALGEDFHRLFEEKITYTPNKKALEQEFKNASPERKQLLTRALDQKGGTVRISFRE